MKLRDWRWYAVYRQIVLAPLVLPVVIGLLLAVLAALRFALSAALLWLLGNADDLADWVRPVGVSGMVMNRLGEGLRLEV